jgi:hypothetical protein
MRRLALAEIKKGTLYICTAEAQQSSCTRYPGHPVGGFNLSLVFIHFGDSKDNQRSKARCSDLFKYIVHCALGLCAWLQSRYVQ